MSDISRGRCGCVLAVVARRALHARSPVALWAAAAPRGLPDCICAGARGSASGLAAAAGVPLDEAALRSLVPAVDQLASVFSEARCPGCPRPLMALAPRAPGLAADRCC